MILLPLRPASLKHKNPQRHKIIHGMSPVGCKEITIDRFEDFLVEYPVCVIVVAGVSFEDAYLFRSFLCFKYVIGLYFNYFSKL